MIMNKILCFDVSSNNCSVAIAVGQEILSFEQELKPSMQAERLLVMIEAALASVNMQYDDLNYLAVTTGPGSFTGIRIGIAAARGILRASNMKPVAISNFEAAHYRLAMQVRDYDSAVIMINAYRGQVYVQEFLKNGTQSTPKLMDNTEIKDMLLQKTGKTACAGSGLAVIYEDIKDIDNLIILPRFPTIKALHIARFADEQINKGIINQIEPLYIRPPDAIIPK